LQPVLTAESKNSFSRFLARFFGDFINPGFSRFVIFLFFADVSILTI
jgi:hypothetical protein